MALKIGIIGGSGLDNPDLLQDFKEIEVDTPFGKPSSPLIIGKIKGIEVAIISRHGRKHEIPPTQVNNRANIYALKYQGCKFILSTTAVGSLKEEIKRGDFVILDQFIDFTKQRKLSFYEKFEFGPIHTPMANPFSEKLRKKLIEACKQLGFPHHEKGTVITIEGPRFSTIAESKMFRLLGADIINMSIAPEAILANEAEVEYATIAMSTDYDCWKQDESPVTWDEISKVFSQNVEKVKQVIVKIIESFSIEEEYRKIKEKIRTIPDFPKPGIMFRDLTTLLQDKDGFRKVIEIFHERYKDRGINIVAGIESRGFIIGGALAEKINAGFVPIRKKGKLPFQVESQEYDLEYGKDTIEIHKDAIKPGEKVLLIDDLIATSGTSTASCKLINKLGGKILECAFIVELEDLGGRQKLESEGYNVFSIVNFKENE
ncbi:MAG: S-methyl-5'-thioadenosine phosphorylase [Nanoarchaeota archaeon]|nr:S-methyl-5'-thioadenosine phosphorylase [Nanoarchaeota archaeon]